MVNLDASAILNRGLASSLGLDRYVYLVNELPRVNIAMNREFQKKYNAFYKVRRNAEWQQEYYSLMERIKQKGSAASFGFVIRELYNKTGMIEASFSSKMIATIDTSNPIWDRKVTDALGIRIKEIAPEKKIDDIIKAYSGMKQLLTEYIESEKGKTNIAIFDEWLPEYSFISSMKKVDYLLWLN